MVNTPLTRETLEIRPEWVARKLVEVFCGGKHDPKMECKKFGGFCKVAFASKRKVKQVEER